MFFTSTDSLLRILVVGACSYVALVLLIRVYGKRSLSQFNAFDLVVTVALGSTLATALLSRSTALADGVLAFVLLLSMQFVVTWLSVRVRAADRVVKSEPRLLCFRGRFLRDAMQDERITEDEVRTGVRSEGFGALRQVEAVVLESSGALSVVPADRTGTLPTSLEGVRGWSDSPRAPADTTGEGPAT
ncbi:MAG: DUF421 domain-containing protein [Planctomycetota bacterium]|nr:DUF421 domain-containing protein [Planctomycetota bacterium]